MVQNHSDLIQFYSMKTQGSDASRPTVGTTFGQREGTPIGNDAALAQQAQGTALHKTAATVANNDEALVGGQHRLCKRGSQSLFATK